MNEQICKECGLQLRGRTDKRFCNDSCRNAFNNRINSKENNILKIINKQLKKNRKILKQFLADEKMYKINTHKLLTEGYSFSYHTHRITTAKGHEYIFCYEYGFLELGDDLFLIVKSSQKGKRIVSNNNQRNE
ncbi:hypothetical protein [Sphingobacterium endophyticum]|uniref:hypothetical protein n=1 Tax=Sphingobacterium endophyticum TaxID=2546448 RepID=UPI0012E29E15|nr:hypothetical protein [Sphingobacterium endophyticum]